jgi:hypothetical protein
MIVKSYAQTNIQLFNQLQAAGYAHADLVRVRDAYGLAMVLFTGCFRRSGNTFIAHLVGTASILAELRCSSTTVAAGLLHSAYSHGEFGDGSRGISESKRNQLRHVVGTDAEILVAQYTTSPWNQQVILALSGSLPLPASVAHQLLLIRLANELEDHLDLVALYSGSVEDRRQVIKSYLFQCVDIAAKLDFPALASALSKAFEETLSMKVAPSLEEENINLTHKEAIYLIAWKSSFLLPPASHRLRLKKRLSRILQRGLLARAVRVALPH